MERTTIRKHRATQRLMHCLTFILIAVQGLSFTAQAASKQENRDSGSQTEKMNHFIDALMSRMTLKEKIGQMNLLSVGFDVTGPVISNGVDEKIMKGQVGAVFNTYTADAVSKLQQLAVTKSRLKIPLLFGYDVIHGHKTIFPIPLGLSCTWDPDLIEKTASAAASEASADGLNWTFSPMVDITRDPRWGRVSEGAGEDPYLGSRIARAMVRGYQGKSLKDKSTILACVKHFALYGAAEAGRDYNTVDMSRLRMFNQYLPPYKAAVDEQVATVMSSFNEIDGIPATGNRWLMTDLLRKRWGFKGFVVTDYTAINEMVAHGVGDERKVSELALNAGIDMDMVGELFIGYGNSLVESHKVQAAQIDRACRRILEAKYKLGLFDDPYRYVSEKRREQIMSPDKLALSREAAVKSMVLLKNNNQLLPLDEKKRIAFIGPLVKDKRNLIGNWSAAGDWKKAVSIWQALGTRFGDKQLLYARGCNLLEDKELIARLNRDGGMITQDDRTPSELIAEAVTTAKKADVVVAVLGESFSMSGEAASRSLISLPDNQVELLKALALTGKPIVLVLMNGRPMTLAWEDAHMEAILETWFSGTMAGPAIVDVLFGDANPQGKLTMSFPRNVGQIPIYYNCKNTGRPLLKDNIKYCSRYLDVPNSPLYPFGYGLSYTTFACGKPILDRSILKQNEKFTVTTTVTNTGKTAGTETVQLYIRDLAGSITRPVKELKGFQKVSLKPSESRELKLELTSDDLSFYNSDMNLVREPGDFEIFVGTNSRDLKKASLRLEE